MTTATAQHAHTCQYIGEQGTQPTCTAAALPGHSYCAEHLAVVYKQGSKRATRHKELRTVDKVRIVESLMNEAIAELEAEGFDCYGDSELNKDLEFTDEVVVEA
jgi:hypothetical protein